MKAEAEDEGTERSGKRLGMTGHVQLNVFDADGVLGASVLLMPDGGQGACAAFLLAGRRASGGRRDAGGGGEAQVPLGWREGSDGLRDWLAVAEGGSVDLLPARGRGERDK